MLGWGIISAGLHPENKIAPAIARGEGKPGPFCRLTIPSGTLAGSFDCPPSLP